MSKIINKILMLSIKNKRLSSIQYTFEKLGFKVNLTIIYNNKDLHFFDKNKCIPLAKRDNCCIHLLTGDKKEIQRKPFSSNKNFVRKKLNEFNLVNIYKEWIPEVLNRENTYKYQFFFIYLALYDQILSSLDYFYQRLQKKFIIIIDDYNLNQLTDAKTVVDDF